MVTRTMFHVTDASNVDSILDEGLHAGKQNKVFVMPDAESAAEYGDLMPVIDDPVVLAVEVMEHKVYEDDEEPGDFDAYYTTGDIPAHDVQPLEEA